jgi:cell division protein FtsL
VRRRDGSWLRAALVGAWLLLLGSGVAAVYARHEARKLFVELQGLERTRDELNIDWGRLRIEQGMLATHARVERLASEKLGMHMPAAEDVSVVRDDETTVASRE